MRRSEPYWKVRSALEDQLRSGRYLMGQGLKAARIADDLNLSPTPVREALAYLAGAGLIEDARGQGYRGLRCDALDVMALFELQTIYLRAAVARVRAPATPSGERLSQAATALGGGGALERRAELQQRLFADMVRLAENPHLVGAYLKLCDQLAPFSTAEAALFRDESADWRQLAMSLRSEDWRAVGHWLEMRLQRRTAAADRLLAIARSAARSDNKVDISTL